jgi:tetratricopeptide (TPR) repeat protein
MNDKPALDPHHTLDRPQVPDSPSTVGVTCDRSASTEPAASATAGGLPSIPGAVVTLRDQGDLPGAIAVFNDALRDRPNFPFAYNNLGITRALKSDLDESVMAFEESIRRDPKNPDTPLNLAKARQMKAARDAKSKPRKTLPPPRPEK